MIVGALYRGRQVNMNLIKEWYAEHTNPNQEQGSVHEVVSADVFLDIVR